GFFPCRTGLVMSSQKKRPVTLTAADRAELVRVTRTGVHPSSVIRRAQVLLALDTSVGVVDHVEVIAARLGYQVRRCGWSLSGSRIPVGTCGPPSAVSSARCRRWHRR